MGVEPRQLETRSRAAGSRLVNALHNGLRPRPMPWKSCFCGCLEQASSAPFSSAKCLGFFRLGEHRDFSEYGKKIRKYRK